MPTHPTEKVPFKEQVIGTSLVYLKFSLPILTSFCRLCTGMLLSWIDWLSPL